MSILRQPATISWQEAGWWQLVSSLTSATFRTRSLLGGRTAGCAAVLAARVDLNEDATPTSLIATIDRSGLDAVIHQHSRYAVQFSSLMALAPHTWQIVQTSSVPRKEHLVFRNLHVTRDNAHVRVRGIAAVGRRTEVTIDATFAPPIGWARLTSGQGGPTGPRGRQPRRLTSVAPAPPAEPYWPPLP